MDLAKIRQKARQVQEADVRQDAHAQMPAAVILADEHVNSEPHEFQVSPPGDAVPVAGISDDPPVVRPHGLSYRHPVSRSPLEVILAGRAAAGCNEELPLASQDGDQQIAEEYQEFLCFRVSDEIYGINIMDIKELIKPREVTEVPRAPSFVSGIISLRGTIIPIIDMLERLGLKRGAETGRERVVVVRNGESFVGLLVDEIIQVVRIAGECLESTPAVLDGIDRDFVSGIGRTDGRMVILLNLASIADINLY